MKILSKVHVQVNTILTIFSLCTWSTALAQNMVTNPSFETSTLCPSGTTGGLLPAHCPPWIRVPGNTPDYFNPCSTSQQTGMPNNAFGYQQPRTGNAYVGIGASYTPGFAISMEYIQVQLSAPLVGGKQYYGSMYVNLSNNSQIAIDRMGMYFSNNSLSQIPGNPNAQPFIAHIANPDFNYLSDTLNWMKVDGFYTASGGEQWLAIGHFNALPFNSISSNPGGSSSRAYYYIDDVCLLDLDGIPNSMVVKDTTICDFPAVIQAPRSGERYLWNTGDTAASITINTPGTYWVKTVNECSFDIDTINVTLTAPTTTKRTIDTFICIGSSLLLTTPGNAYDIEWNTGMSSNSLSVNQPGDYWVKYKVPGCKRNIDTFKVDYPDDPLLAINDTVVCNQKDVYIVTAPEYQSWTWSTGSTMRGIHIIENGDYWVEVFTQHGCKLRDTFSVSLVDTRQILSDTVICNGEFINFNILTSAGNTATFEWQDGSINPYYNVTGPGVYTVEVKERGCSSLNKMDVGIVYCDCPSMVPNAFTPNGDGKNDYFGALFPADCQVRGYLLRIFNRWGDLVFESYDVNNKWDGNLKGKPAEIGVYYYYLQFEKGTKSILTKEKGDITLFR